MISIRRALVSVSDKRNLPTLARALRARGVEVVSTGATARALRAAGAETIEVSKVTGAPEILDGRVKTLHPKIHAAILADGRNAAHRKTLRDMSLQKFDLVAVNFYPFAQTAARRPPLAELIENIDIGGPCLVRAAAKNMANVVCVTDPDDYDLLAAEMERNDGKVSAAFARRLAAKAFAATARYEAAIANEIAARAESDSARTADEKTPFAAERFVALRRERVLRYGENPHQQAALYRVADSPAAADAELLQGGALSYNNILDSLAARALIADLSSLRAGAAAAIVKHNNPCGAAIGPDLASAFARARAADEEAAFGGVVALGGAVDRRLARTLTESFFEIALAPAFDEEARKILEARPRLKVLQLPPDWARPPRSPEFRSVGEGRVVFQIADWRVDKISTARKRRDLGCAWAVERGSKSNATISTKVVTQRSPDAREQRDLRFAWAVTRRVKSNAVVFAKDKATLGVGAGQMSRVDSVWLARGKAERAGHLLVGAVVASDGFFPFADGVAAAAAAGATAVIQPGGSKRDDEVIAAANERGLAMVFVGRRHFSH